MGRSQIEECLLGSSFGRVEDREVQSAESQDSLLLQQQTGW